LRQISLTLINPIVDCVAWRVGDEFPVTRIIACQNEFGRTAIAKCKTRRIGIDTCASAVPDGQPYPAVSRHFDPIDTFLFSRHSRAWRVNLEIFVLTIKLREPNCGGSLSNAQRNAFIAERNDLQSSVFSEPYKVSGVELYFESRVAVG
jgi:hypothetical protein